MARPLVSLDIDARDLKSVNRQLKRLGREGVQQALVSAVNHTGDRATTQVRRAVAKQTGMVYGKVRSATTSYKATYSRPVYEIVGRGLHEGLIHFSAVERVSGVSARPWGKRRVFAGTFIANAVDSGSPQVFRRTGEFSYPSKGRYAGMRREKIEKLWGPSIPREMLRGLVPYQFNATVRERMPARVKHEVERLLRMRMPRTS